MVISYGYPHILKEEVIGTAKKPIINLHISYLPYNKGAHPNFWSNYLNTPCGITIHEIDSGIDTGPIIFQKKIKLNSELSLEESYFSLRSEIEKLFIENISAFESHKYEKSYPNEFGSYNKKNNLPYWVDWQMKIKDVRKRFLSKEKCYVVLGHLMSRDGILDEESKARVNRLIEVTNKEESPMIFFCGWDYREDSDLTIAEAMKNYFIEHSSIKSEIYLSMKSRDTVGDAVFLKRDFGFLLQNKSINLITSDYHCDRAQLIFDFVFGGKQEVIAIPAISKRNKISKTHEEDSTRAFLKTFKSVTQADEKAIYERLKLQHPYYNGLIFDKIK